MNKVMYIVYLRRYSYFTPNAFWCSATRLTQSCNSIDIITVWMLTLLLEEVQMQTSNLSVRKSSTDDVKHFGKTTTRNVASFLNTDGVVHLDTFRVRKSNLRLCPALLMLNIF